MPRLGEPSRAVRIAPPEEYIEQDHPDCSTSTVLSAQLSTINSQLMSQGWAKKPLELNSLSQKNYNEVVAVLFELMGASVSNLNMLDTLNGRHRTLEYEYERLHKTTENLRTTNARLETDIAGWKARSMEMEKRLSVEESKTKELREENARGKKALETVRIAAGHETKKIQMSLDKALAQLTRAGNDATIASRPQGLTLLNPIPAGRVQPMAATQSVLLEQTLRDLTDIRASLQEETEAFRHVAVSTGNALREALAASKGQQPPARLHASQFFTATDPGTRLHSSTITQSASSLSHPALAQKRLQGLVEQIRVRITDGVPQYYADGQQIAKIASPEEYEEQKRVEREKEKKQRDLEDRIKDLQLELECARKRDEEASKVVADYAKKQVQQVLNVDDRDYDEEMERQKQALDSERRRYAEEAVKLRQERNDLESERQSFLEQRRKVEEVEARLAALPLPLPEAIVAAHVPLDEEPPTAPSGSNWYQHRPQSPSPLSPHKPRTPKAHLAGGRRKSAKTPLSRLVLEKAVRQKGRDLGVSGLLMKEKDSLRGGVLGPERGKRTNASNSVSTASSKGQERSNALKSSTMETSSTLAKSRSSGTSSSRDSVTPPSQPTTKTPASSAERQAPFKTSSLRTSTGASTARVTQRKVDLSKTGGIGPTAAAKKTVWR